MAIELAEAFVNVKIDQSKLNQDLSKTHQKLKNTANQASMSFRKSFLEFNRTITASAEKIAGSIRKILAPITAGIALAGKSYFGQVTRSPQTGKKFAPGVVGRYAEAEKAKEQFQKIFADMSYSLAKIFNQLLKIDVEGKTVMQWAEFAAKSLRNLKKEDIQKLAEQIVKLGKTLAAVSIIKILGDITDAIASMGEKLANFLNILKSFGPTIAPLIGTHLAGNAISKAIPMTVKGGKYAFGGKKSISDFMNEVRKGTATIGVSGAAGAAGAGSVVLNILSKIGKALKVFSRYLLRVAAPIIFIIAVLKKLYEISPRFKSAVNEIKDVLAQLAGFMAGIFSKTLKGFAAVVTFTAYIIRDALHNIKEFMTKGPWGKFISAEETFTSAFEDLYGLKNVKESLDELNLVADPEALQKYREEMDSINKTIADLTAEKGKIENEQFGMGGSFVDVVEAAKFAQSAQFDFQKELLKRQEEVQKINEEILEEQKKQTKLEQDWLDFAKQPVQGI